jgi:hypothetical protein
MTVEQEIKQQFARRFERRDWPLFKRMAEFYLRRAAILRKADVDVPPDLKLLVRNCQKRLCIGLGVELLLKAAYLKYGWSLNRLAKQQACAPKFPHTFEQVAGFTLLQDETHMLGTLIDGLPKAPPLDSLNAVTRGLKIAKVFRNKEGHGVLPAQTFHASNYRDVEGALVEVYRLAFAEKLQIHFAVAQREHGVWRTSPT